MKKIINWIFESKKDKKAKILKDIELKIQQKIKSNKEAQVEMNKKLEEDCKREALIDFNDWKFHTSTGQLYDPSAVRWLRVILATDPDTCINIEETRKKEFERLQEESSIGIYQSCRKF